MKNIIATIALTLAAGSVEAACYGSGSYYNCSDSSGNNYSVQKYGNTTVVNGSNVNGSWSSTSQKFGNTTYQNGTSIDGGRWNQTIQSTPYGTTRSGTNSNGRAFSKTCNAYGCY